jgi:hypothetical protein
VLIVRYVIIYAGRRGVDPYEPCFRPPGDGHRFIEIVGEDRGDKPLANVVGEPHGFFG